MVYTISLRKQGKGVYTIGPERVSPQREAYLSKNLPFKRLVYGSIGSRVTGLIDKSSRMACVGDTYAVPRLQSMKTLWAIQSSEHMYYKNA